MKNTLSIALVLGACIVAGDRLWTIAAAALMILAAAAIQAVPVIATAKEAHHGEMSDPE